MHCIASIVKYIVYIFNIVFLICGIALITLGSIILVDISNITDYSSIYNPATIPIIITSIGSVIFLVCFFGCCGAIRENSCCTMIYAVFMFLMFCFQLSLTIWIFVEYQSFLDAMTSIVTSSWQNNNAVSGYPMDSLQMSFNCCGVNSSQDYTAIGQPVPNSCCQNMNNPCPASVYTNKPGCQQQFYDFWASNMNIVAYTGIGIALVEIVAFTFSCFLLNSFRRTQRHNL